jgi:hypothetical protein
VPLPDARGRPAGIIATAELLSNASHGRPLRSLICPDP